MDTDDLNIQQHLAYSKKLHGLSTAHLQETRQLLDTIEQLQSDMQDTLDENQRLREKISRLTEESQAKDTIIQAQAQRIADLQQNTTYHIGGDYIENQHIKHQYTTSIPISGKRRTAPRKLNHNDPTQLPLWNATST
ncbi:MAG: hypothetical protein ACI4BD_01210 [Paludibacteraceae bacterium]